MDRILSVSSTTICKDQNNLIVWLGFDEDTRGFSDWDKLPYKGLLNQEIKAILDAQVPTGVDKILLMNQRLDPSIREFVEKGNDLSRILWLAWH